jgi:two-component system NarL family response regulator
MPSLKVLLVDDHETFLHIDMAEPDVAVTDLAMPGIGGLTLIQDIRAKYANVGVVALTLFDTNEHREAALAAGAHAFVPKAILRTDLMAAIHEAASAVGNIPD